jgi:hypothetical protein
MNELRCKIQEIQGAAILQKSSSSSSSSSSSDIRNTGKLEDPIRLIIDE